jgi:hypothetical protein
LDPTNITNMSKSISSSTPCTRILWTFAMSPVLGQQDTNSGL